VEGTVIETNGSGVKTSHEPVQWGNITVSETDILPSTYLQKKWGGKGENGMPCKGPETTPSAFYNGQPLKSTITR